LSDLSIEERLGLDKFTVDEEEAHIVLNKEVCASCATRPCTFVCPARLYVWENEEMRFDYAGCVECGTCRVACPFAETAMTWNYPRGTFGISYRYS
jgi:ferredoxin like protein